MAAKQNQGNLALRMAARIAAKDFYVPKPTPKTGFNVKTRAATGSKRAPTGTRTRNR